MILFWPLFNRIGGVMVSVLASSAVDIWSEPWSGQTKDYNNGIRCFSVYQLYHGENKLIFHEMMMRSALL
jgi:hypothetical protein